jgi:predicted MFS family arabinose efflux permease
MTSEISGSWRTPTVVLICGSLTVLLAFGFKASFGLFLKPMSTDLGWNREIFAFAMALQNLLVGVFQPFAGAIADKWGSGRVVAAGSLLFALGLFIMSETLSPFTFYLGGGVLVALGLSASSLGLVLGVVSRRVSPERRSWALGIITSAGSLGQLTMVPLGQAFLSMYGWAKAFLLLGICSLVRLPMAGALISPSERASESSEQSLGEALGEARRHGGFWFLTAGFFVCGFHVAFIAVHLPAQLTDIGFAAELGAWALSIIGLFNIFGSIISGVLGGKLSKKYLLGVIYSSRAVVFLLFILIPKSTWSVLTFSAVIGLLWLSTVPPTSGLVVQIFGPRYMTTLFGIVHFSHQVGSFSGVWLGGYLFDVTGSYTAMWWLSVALGLVATALHLPIDERTVPRLTKAE